MFRFRLDFSISSTGLINLENNFNLLLNKNKSFSLESLDRSSSKTKYFRINSEKYEEKLEAEIFGELLANSLLMLGVKWGIGVNIEPSGLTVITIENSIVISPEIPTSHTLSATKSFKDFEKDLAAIYNSEMNISDAKFRLALELYNASQFEISIEAQFLTLLMAMECIIDEKERNDIAKDVVNELKGSIENSGIDSDDKEAMVKAVANLVYKSTRQQLKALANDLLAGKKYNGQSAHKFIKDCYSKRNDIVHPKVKDKPKNNESDTPLTFPVEELKRFATDVLLEKSKLRQQ